MTDNQYKLIDLQFQNHTDPQWVDFMMINPNITGHYFINVITTAWEATLQNYASAQVTVNKIHPLATKPVDAPPTFQQEFNDVVVKRKELYSKLVFDLHQTPLLVSPYIDVDSIGNDVWITACIHALQLNEENVNRFVEDLVTKNLDDSGRIWTGEVMEVYGVESTWITGRVIHPHPQGM